LDARFAEDERVAQDASNRIWFEQDNLIEVYPEREDDGFLGFPTRSDARHAAKWQPKRVLVEIQAKRALLDRVLSEKHLVATDCWHTCAAATTERDGGETCDEDREGKPCDCGRDARVDWWLRVLAMPYADRAGFDEAWRPVIQ
jgi:hypothetical protein